jgi:hypothetical protein
MVSSTSPTSPVKSPGALITILVALALGMIMLGNSRRQ